jgi:GTP-binding protein Era
LAIVTPKVQTTRTRLLGIVIDGEAQLIFVDTPGIFAPRRRLDRAMVAAAWAGAADADRVVLLVDAARPEEPDTGRIVGQLVASGRRAILAAEQDRPGAAGRAARHRRPAATRRCFDDIFMISGLTGDGVDDLRRHLAALMPAGPWLFPEDQLSDAPERWLAAEITREQVFLQLHDELPYAASVRPNPGRSAATAASRSTRSSMSAGPVNAPSCSARRATASRRSAPAPVPNLSACSTGGLHLFLFVKVRDNWIEDPERFAAIGLDYNV